MDNYEIADYFSLLSRLMDIHGENSFRAKSYSIAAFNIENLPRQIEEMDDSELFSQKGIGESTGRKIREIQASGKMEALEKLIVNTPPGVVEMLKIKGLGPKKIHIIWKRLGIESLGELEYACNENRLLELKGFGTKTQQTILESIRYYLQNQGFYLWATAESFALSILGDLKKAFPEYLFEMTGALRRQENVVAFAELVTDLPPDLFRQKFSGDPEVLIEEMPGAVLIIRTPAQPALRIFYTGRKDFYRTLFETTGSEEFIKAFFERYQTPAQPESEIQIFEANKLAFIPPALRETENILEKAALGTLDSLIEMKDIKGIIHSHSTYSDGLDKIKIMAEAAKAQGFEYLVISDHSQAAFYANGLSPERIAEQHQEIDALNEKLKPFKIFKSIEADILSDGTLDYNENVLRTFDLVIASVHSNLKMTQEKAMSRLLKAIENPYTTILGHATGRLLLSRKGYPVDHKELIDACARNQVVIEINAHPKRLDMDWQWINYALEKEVLLSINPDAHSVNGFRDIYYGVKTAQKGGLTAKNNLSSFPLSEFELFLKNRKENAGKLCH